MRTATHRRRLLSLLLGGVVAIAAGLGISITQPAQAARGGQLKLKVIDRETGQPIAFRMHLVDQRQRPRKLPDWPSWHDHTTAEGEVLLKLPRGNYAFEIECGPEYVRRFGNFVINDNAMDEKVVDMQRFVDMADLGWFAADFDLHRDPEEVPLLMRAENFHATPVITHRNTYTRTQSPPLPAEPVKQLTANTFIDLSGTQFTYNDNTLSFFRLNKRLELPKPDAGYADVIRFLTELKAKHPDVWVDASHSNWDDLPLWVGLGLLDSVGIAPREFGLRSTDRKLPGRTSKDLKYNAVHGQALWMQDIYYELLNCGIRLAPSAGSGSGLPGNANPAAYNRVYVHAGDEPNPVKWWTDLASGQALVSNGPIILPVVQNLMPGATLYGQPGEPVTISAGLTLHTRDQIDYLEIVQNGRVARVIPLRDYIQQRGRLPEITFTESGWFLFRAVCETEKTYRFAATAPYFVNFDGQTRISRQSVKFFQDWLQERSDDVLPTVTDPADRQLVEAAFAEARLFWGSLAERANAE